MRIFLWLQYLFWMGNCFVTLNMGLCWVWRTDTVDLRSVSSTNGFWLTTAHYFHRIWCTDLTSAAIECIWGRPHSYTVAILFINWILYNYELTHFTTSYILTSIIQCVHYFKISFFFLCHKISLLIILYLIYLCFVFCLLVCFF